MAIGQREEVVAIEELGGDQAVPKGPQIPDPGQALGGPTRAPHDDLRLDLVGH